MKNILSFILRLILFTPISLLAAIFGGFGAFFEKISEGLYDIASSVRQITMAPYVKDLEKSIEEEDARDREYLLESLK